MNLVKDLLDYLEASPTAAHAVEEAAKRLVAAGFKPRREEDSWKLKTGDAFLVVREHGALVAGVVGSEPPEKTGFRLVGAHTDVPALRLKADGQFSREGYRQWGVEVYGGPLLATWFDRDLALAGRLVVRDKKGRLQERLVRLKKPVCRIPSLALHLDRRVEEEGLKIDRQNHLPAILGLGEEDPLAPPLLRRLLGAAAAVEPESIAAWRLDLVDAQGPAIGGAQNEFILARGVDNLVSCYAAVQALAGQEKLRPATAVVALFDSEEVGSTTTRGAGSTLLDVVLERLCLSGRRPRESLQRALARSLLVSADGAHAVHPNRADRHDPQHKPQLNGGPVIKINAAERYATTLATQAYLQACGDLAGVPIQHYVHRSDLPCGTTIGPISATRLGVAAVDVGAPMLSMHSIRETTGVNDPSLLAKLLAAHLSGRVPLVK